MKPYLLKLTIFTINLFLVNTMSYSQDLIATKKGDSINCYITKVKPDYIHFLMKGKDGKPFNTVIARNSVAYFEVDYYTQSEVGNDIIKLQQSKSGVLFSFDYAYSLRLGEVDGSIPSSIAKQLKNGTSFTAQFGYFYANTAGFGLIYNRHSTHAVSTTSSIDDKVIISYVAPVFYFQNASDMNKAVFTSGFSIGYLGFNEKLSSPQGGFNLKGSSLGVGLHAYIGSQVNDVVRLSFKASFIAGSLSSVVINGQSVQLPEDQRENLSTLSLGASIGFLLK